MQFLSICFGMVLYLISLAVPPGLGALSLAAVGCLLVNAGLFFSLWRLDRKYLAYKFFATFFIFQSLFFCLLLLVFGNEVESTLSMTSLMTGPPMSLFFSFNLVPILAVLYASILDKQQRATRFTGLNYVGQPIKSNAFIFHFPRMGVAFEAMLVMAAFINLSVWVTGAEGNLFMAAMRVLYRTVIMVPLMAGLYWKRSQLVRVVWLGTMAVNIFFATFTGARSYAFYPILFYGIGFLLQQNSRRAQVRWIIIGLVASIPTVLLVGFIGNLRAVFGRSDATQAEYGDVVRNINLVVEKSEQQDFLSWEANPGDALWYGMTRLVDWTLVDAPNMSPSSVPYRGYWDFGDEVKSMASFATLGLFPNWGYNSLMFAQLYGFEVYMDRDSEGLVGSYTVPFGVVADAWSRYGLLSALVQIAAAILLLTLGEKILMTVFLPRQIGLFAFLRTLLAAIAESYLTGYSLTGAIREMLVAMPFALMTVGVIMLLIQSILSQGGMTDAGQSAEGPPLARRGPAPARGGPPGQRRAAGVCRHPRRGCAVRTVPRSVAHRLG